MHACCNLFSVAIKVIVGLAVAILIGPSPTYGQNGSVAVAYPAKGFVIDGDLGDWPKDLQVYPIERIEFGDKLGNKDDLKAQFRIAFAPADHALYVAVEVQDDSTILDGPGEVRWDAQDGCELFLDAAHLEGGSSVTQYARYGNQNRVVGPGEALEKAMKVAVKRTETATVYEWRIEMAGDLGLDRVLGFDVSVADKDKDGSFSWAAWGSGTQKIDVADRCGEVLLVAPGTRFGDVSGTLAWIDASPSALPSRVRIQSARSPQFWRGAIVEGTGAYKAGKLPAGPYSIHAVDSSELRIDAKPHVDVQVEADVTVKAGALRIAPIPWPGLIGDSGVLRGGGDINPAEIDRVVQTYLDYFKIPGMSLAVIKDSKVVYHRGFGVKDATTSEPVTEGTMFEAASMTKPLFAYTVLRLVDRKILDLDTPLYTYLPYEDIAHDDRYKLITARMVLTHRTGFPNWRTGKLDIKFVPGTQFSYSGEGFVYLGKVVEKLTGKKLVEICRDEVFVPLGIENASLVWNEQVDRVKAMGHDRAKPLQRWKVTDPNMAASLHIDAGNYAKFLIAVLKGKGLSESSVKEMLRSQIEIPDQKGHSVGLGIMMEQTPLGTTYGHGGRNTGFTSNSAMLKDAGIGYVFLVNNDDAPKMDNVLLAYLLAGKSVLKNTKPIAHKTAKVEPMLYDAYVGRYRIAHETVVTFTREGDRLFAQPDGEGRFEVFPESETVFFINPSTDATITFVRDDKGKVTEILLHRDGKDTKAIRIEGDAKQKPPAAAKPAAEGVLKAGMRAPEFRVERFLKGETFSALKRGEVYALDFWATGCGPCVMSMPHLSELQREYRDRHVTICGVNVWEAPEYNASTLETVSQFVQDQGDRMDFTVAYDGAAKHMDNAWMHAAEKNGIPCTFVVDREGVVAWIGHPMMLDMVLDEICRGQWDIASGPERLKRASASFAEAVAKYKEGLAAGDAAWEKAMTQYPAVGRNKASERLGALLRAGHFAAAHALGDRLIGDARKAQSSGSVLVVLEALGSPGALADDSARALLLKAAEAYFALVDTKDYGPHVVMARAYFYAGRDKEARAATSKALELAPGKVRGSVEKYLNDTEQLAKQK